jgi:hypothetical protein
VTVGGEEQVEWLLMRVLKNVTKVFSDEWVSSLKTKDDDTRVRDIIDDFEDIVFLKIRCFFSPDIAKLAS